MYTILIGKRYRNVYEARLTFLLVRLCHGDRMYSILTRKRYRNVRIYFPEVVEAPTSGRKGLPTTRPQSREYRLPNTLETPCSSRDLSRTSMAATNMERIMRAKLIDGSREDGREVNATVETASLGWEKQGLREGASTRTFFLGRVAGFDNGSALTAAGVAGTGTCPSTGAFPAMSALAQARPSGVS